MSMPASSRESRYPADVVRLTVLDQVRRELGSGASEWLAFDAEFSSEVLRPNAGVEPTSLDLGELVTDVVDLLASRRRLGLRLDVTYPEGPVRVSGRRERLLLCLAMLVTVALRHESPTASTSISIWADGDSDGAVVGLTTPRLDTNAFDLARTVAESAGATLGRTALEDRDVIALSLASISESNHLATDRQTASLRLGLAVGSEHLSRVLETFCRSVHDVSAARDRQGDWDVIVTDDLKAVADRPDAPVLLVGSTKPASSTRRHFQHWLPTPFSRQDLLQQLDHLHVHTRDA